MNARLYINYQEVELSKKDLIALSLGVNRLTDIQTRQGYYSNTFRLPKTATNLEIFGHPQELNSTDTKRYERLVAWIESDGVQVVYGFAELKTLGDNLEVVVKGGNSDWIDEIRDRELSDLDLSDLDHQANLAGVSSNRFNDYTDGFVYPDIDYGLLQKLDGKIQYWMLYPSIFVKVLIDRIFAATSWTLVNNLDSVELYKQLIIPFSNEKVYHTDSWATGKEFNCHISSHSIIHTALNATWYAGIDDASTPPYYDNDSQITLGAWDNSVPLAGYTPTEQVEQTFTAVIDFEVTHWTNTVSIFAIAFPNVGVLEDFVQYVHTDADGTGTFQATITARTLTEVFQTIEITSNNVGVNITGGTFSSSVETTHFRGSLWEFGINMPNDFSQTDLVRYVMNAFCIIAVPNEQQKTLTFVQFDDVPSNQPEDWSDKLDLSEDATITPEYGSYQKSNILSYSNDSSDEFIKESRDLGEHTITNQYKPTGKKTLYKAPFSLCNRVLTMGETMTKAAIDLHDSEAGYEDLNIKQLSISSVSNDGVIEVSSGASDIDEGTRITLFGLDGSQQWNGSTINNKSFNVTAIEEDNKIHLGKTFTGTEATTGTAYLGVFGNFISVSGSSNIQEGYELIFADTNGSQTIGGVSIEGQSTIVNRQYSDTTLSINKFVSGTPVTSQGRVYYIEDYYKLNKTTTRIGVHKVVPNSSAVIQIIGASTVTDASEVYFEDISWNSLVSNYWQTLTGIIQSPQMVKALIRLSALDVNQIDFTRPKYIDYFGCMFYLSYVDQFKTNQVDSTEVELVKLP